MQLLAEERDRADRTLQEFCVAICDLDHFKSINDRFARLGGEEFVLMLRATSPEAAAFTVSVGITVFHAGEAVEELLARADRILYDATHAGRNRILSR